MERIFFILQVRKYRQNGKDKNEEKYEIRN